MITSKTPTDYLQWNDMLAAHFFSEEKAGRRAKVGGANVHRFRDTFCTRLADRGVPIDRIQKLAGHTDIRMTLRYTKTREAGLREAIATLEAG